MIYKDNKYLLIHLFLLYLCTLMNKKGYVKKRNTIDCAVRVNFIC